MFLGGVAEIIKASNDAKIADVTKAILLCGQ